MIVNSHVTGFKFFVRPKLVLIMFFAFFAITCVDAQSKNIPSIADFFEKLKHTRAYTGELRYDTVGSFDFVKFKPGAEYHPEQQWKYVVGFDKNDRIRTIGFFSFKDYQGILRVHDFGTFKIMKFLRPNAVENLIPSIPILCVSENSRFLVFLKNGYQNNKLFTTDDIASIQFLRPHLYPEAALIFQNSIVRVAVDMNYINGNSKLIESLSLVIPFEPEKNRQLHISPETVFDYGPSVTRGDFFLTAQLYRDDPGIPIWMTERGLEFK